MSTSIWESLLNAKMSIFNHISHETLMRMMKKGFFMIFNIFHCACVGRSKYTTYLTPKKIKLNLKNMGVAWWLALLQVHVLLQQSKKKTSGCRVL